MEKGRQSGGKGGNEHSFEASYKLQITYFANTMKDFAGDLTVNARSLFSLSFPFSVPSAESDTSHSMRLISRFSE